ncbi:MAG: VWA domain-containing protein [Lentisphaeria bacterium]|nr:VWA domain-containing protein [Lentisphaeria bacterium]
MKHDYTHLIIVLDASGSMSSIQDDIKGSFNEFLKKQREEPGKTVFDLFQFNDEVKRTVKSADLAQFHDDLMARYDCSGCTALNDAVCIAIDTVGHAFADMEEAERPEHVLCVIITDGMENASREYTSKDVKDRIEHQKTAYKWDFQFLAANQDVFATGESIGLDKSSCMNFVADAAGVNMLCSRMNLCMDKIRNSKKKRTS